MATVRHRTCEPGQVTDHNTDRPWALSARVTVPTYPQLTTT